jgi:DNA-binding GntR family transcriptional regulator
MTASRIGKLSSSSLATQARERIRDAIFKGLIQPDERLTIERIAQELGVSRTPVREALKALEADGIVRLLPHRGAVVQRFDEAEIMDRYSVRATLEGHAGELACRRDPARLHRELEGNCEAMEALITAGIDNDDLTAIGSLVELNDAFHRMIIEASGSAVTIRLLETLRRPAAYRLYHWATPDRRDQSVRFHRSIIEACRDRKPRRVRKLIEEHLLEARDFLLKRA